MGFVYFLQARQSSSLTIKIGCTDQCPFRRLQEVRKKRPALDALELVAVIETRTPARDERIYQKRFAHLKCKGRGRDWFWSDDELTYFIHKNAGFHLCDPECHKRTPGDVRRKQQVDAFRAKLTKRTNQQVRAFEATLQAARAERRRARSGVTAPRLPR